MGNAYSWGGAYFKFWPKGGAFSGGGRLLKIKDLSNDIMKSKLTERIKQYVGVNYHNFRKNILKHGNCLVSDTINSNQHLC